jgi:hypothetical protein
MKQTNLTSRRPAAGRRISGHAQEDHVLDPYQLREKLHEPTVCPQCGAVYRRGRWHWATRPEEGIEAHCPACRRINDKFPAGIVHFHGRFEQHRIEEIVNLARHQEQAEKGEHPLNRIISIDEEAQGIVIRTTEFICLAASARPLSTLSTAPSMSISTKADISCVSTGGLRVKLN